jgi:hypothetical protein
MNTKDLFFNASPDLPSRVLRCSMKKAFTLQKRSRDQESGGRVPLRLIKAQRDLERTTSSFSGAQRRSNPDA